MPWKTLLLVQKGRAACQEVRFNLFGEVLSRSSWAPPSLLPWCYVAAVTEKALGQDKCETLPFGAVNVFQKWKIDKIVGENRTECFLNPSGLYKKIPTCCPKSFPSTSGWLPQCMATFFLRKSEEDTQIHLTLENKTAREMLTTYLNIEWMKQATKVK